MVKQEAWLCSLLHACGDAYSHVQVSSYSRSAICEAAVRYSSPFQFFSIMASLEFYTDNTLEILPESEIVAVVDAANSTRTFPFRLSEQPFLASRQTYWRNFSEQVSYLVSRHGACNRMQY